MRNKTFYEKYRELAIKGEAYRNFAYDDATGQPPITQGHLTIGIGHNLGSRGLSDRVIDMIFMEDYEEVLRDLMGNFHWWPALDEVRQLAVFDLRFNLGPITFREFSTTIGFLERKDFPGAAQAFRCNKRYFAQVGRRAERIASMIETGDLA